MSFEERILKDLEEHIESVKVANFTTEQQTFYNIGAKNGIYIVLNKMKEMGYKID